MDRDTKNRLPIYIDDKEPEVDDPAKESQPQAWYPADRLTNKLLRCLEALNDIERMLGIIAAQDNPESDVRLVKQLATPLYTLISATKAIFYEIRELSRDGKWRLTKNQDNVVTDHCGRFIAEVAPQEANIKIVRDKLSAHLDLDALHGKNRKVWRLVDLKSFLSALRTSLEALHFLLALDIYSWTCDGGHPDVVRLMSTDATAVDMIIKDGRPVSILSITMVRSPKYTISDRIQSVVRLYDSIIDIINNQRKP